MWEMFLWNTLLRLNQGFKRPAFQFQIQISIVDIDSGWINHFIQYMDNFVCSMCQTILINGQCWASSRVGLIGRKFHVLFITNLYTVARAIIYYPWEIINLKHSSMYPLFSFYFMIHEPIHIWPWPLSVMLLCLHPLSSYLFFFFFTKLPLLKGQLAKSLSRPG